MRIDATPWVVSTQRRPTPNRRGIAFRVRTGRYGWWSVPSTFHVSPFTGSHKAAVPNSQFFNRKKGHACNASRSDAGKGYAKRCGAGSLREILRGSTSVVRLRKSETRRDPIEPALAVRRFGNRSFLFPFPLAYSSPIPVRCPTGSRLRCWARAHRSRAPLSSPSFSAEAVSG
jgi:hypothetical protein